jgi:pantothenate kinase-related protein Tda10
MVHDLWRCRYKPSHNSPSIRNVFLAAFRGGVQFMDLLASTAANYQISLLARIGSKPFTASRRSVEVTIFGPDGTDRA